MIWMLTTEMTPKVGNDIAPSLRSRDYKDPPPRDMGAGR